MIVLFTCQAIPTEAQRERVAHLKKEVEANSLGAVVDEILKKEKQWLPEMPIVAQRSIAALKTVLGEQGYREHLESALEKMLQALPAGVGKAGSKLAFSGNQVYWRNYFDLVTVYGTVTEYYTVCGPMLAPSGNPYRDEEGKIIVVCEDREREIDWEEEQWVEVTCRMWQFDVYNDQGKVVDSYYEEVCRAEDAELQTWFVVNPEPEWCDDCFGESI